jgi:hypothetical protein
MSEQDARPGQFRPNDIPKYSPDVDHPFKMYRTNDGQLGFSPGLVRPSISYGTPQFVPTLYGQQLKMPVTGQLTTTASQPGRWFVEATGFWLTVAAIQPRNLRLFVPTAGQIKHETDAAFGDPNKKFNLIGTVKPDGTIDQLLRSDITMSDMASMPYEGPPGAGPHDPIVTPWPPDPPTPGSGDESTPRYGYGTDGEEGFYGDFVFDYGD